MYSAYRYRLLSCLQAFSRHFENILKLSEMCRLILAGRIRRSNGKINCITAKIKKARIKYNVHCLLKKGYTCTRIHICKC